ncbi:MAG: hypothetical protein KKB50_02370, partial [Planctomycetes bacterium]|nr:hypothetical protein [Planctomycetota bacterium]
LNLLKTGPPQARSIRARRLLAGWNQDYLLSLLIHEPNPINLRMRWPWPRGAGPAPGESA